MTEHHVLSCPQVRDLIYREILEYHPQMLADFLSNGMNRGANFMYPSAVDNFRRQCVPLLSRHLPPAAVCLRYSICLPCPAEILWHW